MSLPTTRTVLRDYVALSELNYIYPFGVLPSNNFFRRIRPNPFYLANELRNIDIDLERKPTTYDTHPTVAVQYDKTLPEWDKMGPSAGVTILSAGTKTLVGPYFDTINNQAGVQYDYTLNGKLKMMNPVKIADGYVLLAFNLQNKPVPSVFTTNLVKYVRTEMPMPEHHGEATLDPCKTMKSDPEGDFTPAIRGRVTFNGKLPAEQLVVSLNDAVPYVDCAHCGEGRDVYYAILGKRIYFAIKLPIGTLWDVDSANYTIQLGIIEEKAPTLFTALSPV